MTRIVFVFFILLLFQACSTEKKVGGETATGNKEPVSPRREARGSANGINIVVDYGSPSVKGRKIWGGLQKFDRVWRAGANETTSVSIDKDALINGEPLDQGKYAFFIIPKEDEDWIVIFNTDWDEWGAFSYNEEKNVLRLSVKPEWTDTNQEKLEYSIKDDKLNFSWEKARLSLEIQPAQ